MPYSIRQIFLEKLRKILLPDFTNKLTWLLGSAGVTLIAGPALFRLVGKISTEVYGFPLELEFFSEDRSGYGTLLCFLAVTQNIGYQVKGSLSEALAIKNLDREHAMQMLKAQHSHEQQMKEADSKIATKKFRRTHDVNLINELVLIFPFEDSCDSLIRAAEIGISDSFQESLGQLGNLHHISHKMYNQKAEEARVALILQAKQTKGVLSNYLEINPMHTDCYVPCFDQKKTGLHEIYYENQEKMRASCINLIRAYESFVTVLQHETLWGVDV